MEQHGERSETSRSSRRRNAHYTDLGRGMPAVSRRAARASRSGTLDRHRRACQHSAVVATQLGFMDDLTILFRDPHLIAVDKPAGLLVHRSAIDRHETRFALQLLRDQIGQRVYPVHRMDKPTSGVLLFALHVDAARRMTALFTAGQVQKTYLTVVRGHTPVADVIDYPLKEELDAATDIEADATKAAQPAVTAYRRLAIADIPHAVGRYPSARYSLLEVTPHTGRKHQIRRHLKHIFHPIVGDTTHGDGRHNRFFRTHFECHRLLLTATRLVFAHPYGGETITITALPDPVFCSVFKKLDWRAAEPTLADICGAPE